MAGGTVSDAFHQESPRERTQWSRERSIRFPTSKVLNSCPSRFVAHHLSLLTLYPTTMGDTYADRVYLIPEASAVSKTNDTMKDSTFVRCNRITALSDHASKRSPGTFFAYLTLWKDVIHASPHPRDILKQRGREIIRYRELHHLTSDTIGRRPGNGRRWHLFLGSDTSHLSHHGDRRIWLERI